MALHKRIPTLINDDGYLNHPLSEQWYQSSRDSCDLVFTNKLISNHGNLFLTSIEALKGDEGIQVITSRNVTKIVSMGVNIEEEHPKLKEELIAYKYDKEVIVIYCPIDDTVDAMDGLVTYLQSTYDFIDEELMNKNGGSVIVHCRQGISRSASIIIYYLMMKFQIPALLALKRVQKSRKVVNPNKGFFRILQQHDPKEI